MPRYVVRTNCEYSIEIDADISPDEALAQAAAIDLNLWTQAWAEFEVEEEED